ncbi:MAG: Na+/H+ antiporter subunit E [Chitinophagaceae bacterium]|nr:Na+/H+ antiporter subunit E [Chitinophagaceae bacterium]
MQKRFLMNVLLTVIWVALTGSFDYLNFIFGFLVSFFVMWIISRNTDDRKYFTIAFKVLGFFFFFLYEFFKATIEVAYEVMTKRFQMKPGIIKMPLDAKTDLEITLLSNLISLTPGTLVLDVSEDRTVIYIHGMYVEDKVKFINSIKEGLEKPLLSIMR